MLDRQKRSGFEGTLTPPRFMGREHLQKSDVNRPDEPTPSPLPGGEPATGAGDEAPLLGGAGGGFMERIATVGESGVDRQPHMSVPRALALL